MIIKGYKVTDHLMRSAYVVGSGLSIKYKLGEWIEPTLENSKLFVFRTLYSAKAFSPKGGERIFKCEIEGGRKADMALDEILSIFAYSNGARSPARKFWKYFSGGKSMWGVGFALMTIPKETILADRIKLIREVKR